MISSETITVGTHIIADFVGISVSVFEKNNYDTMIGPMIENSLLKNHMTLLQKSIHHFDDNGAVTALYLLSESHLSIHTWTELTYLSLDIYTCGNCNPENVLKDIVEYLQPNTVQISVIQRGIHTPNKSLNKTMRKRNDGYDVLEEHLIF
jgi:S-adenosylmethionine decarboxylase proenzyme